METLGRVWEKPDDTGRDRPTPDGKAPRILRFLDRIRSLAPIRGLRAAPDPVDDRRNLTVY